MNTDAPRLMIGLCRNLMCSLITFGRQYKEADLYKNWASLHIILIELGGGEPTEMEFSLFGKKNLM